jgi:hypothetical protein
MTDFDSEIDKQHRQAQDAEIRAVQVLERMRQIPGMATIVDKMPRRFGQAPNPYAPGARNLTAAGLLERHDPALAHHLATLVGSTSPRRTMPPRRKPKRKPPRSTGCGKPLSALLLKTSCTAEHANVHRWLACRC